MHYHKSPLRKLKKSCLGIYYDYRKIAIVFFCYSLLGTGLILSAASAFGENSLYYKLSGEKEDSSEDQHETRVAEAAASKNQSIQDALEKIKSRTTSYSLTGNTPEAGKEDLSDDAKHSQKDAQDSTASNAETSSSTDEKKTNHKIKHKDPKHPYNISDYSKKELQILERIVEAEAGDQTLKGRIMVAHVVLNRVASNEFPDSIKKVVFQKNKSTYQFSPIKDGRYYDVKISKKTKKAVTKAFESPDLTEGALYFMSRSGSSKKNVKWFDSSLTRITSHGCHEFFK